MKTVLRLAAGLTFASCLAAPAALAEDVDVALVLAADVSRSMTLEELKIQRDGYAAALGHPDVIRAIRSGLHGRIALTYVEWAGSASQTTIVPWTLVEVPEDAEAFAAILGIAPTAPARRTSVSAAINLGASLLSTVPHLAMRKIIDISGDGANNEGEPVEAARDRAVAMGLTINGLPLMTRGGLYSEWDIGDLDVYYRDCVIGGPAAFSFPVNDWAQFPEAVRRKLVMEIAGVMPAARVWRVASGTKADCMAGEKRWQQRGLDFQ